MDAPESVANLEQLFFHVQAELRTRLSRGEACTTEILLAEFPALASDPAYGRRIAVEEYLARRELGHGPDVEEWYRRFPSWAADLREAFAHMEAEQTSRCQTTTLPCTSGEGTQTDSVVQILEPSTPLRRLGRYELIVEIGKGGMGRVYRAHDSRLGREVALKTLRVGTLAEPDQVTRFLNEARVGARVHHPNIMPVYEMDEEDGCHFFTMPLAPGGSLAQRCQEYREPQMAVRLLVKVARAVGAAHALHIIHRDLKPGNILFDEQGEPLVADFGLAKDLGESRELTQTGQLLGTPAYMAPEQLSGHGREATAATDVWALGVILHQLLMGRRPSDPSTTRHSPQEPPGGEKPTARRLEDLDGQLQAVLRHCLADEPSGRYATANELADDLERWREGKKVLAPTPSRWRRGARWLRRHPLVGLAAAALCGVLLLTAAFRYSGYDSPERQLQTQFRQLEQGKAVTLVGQEGAPKRLSWFGSEGAVAAPRSPDGSFTLHSMTLSCLQMLPSCPLTHYKLSADVRQRDAAAGGRVGLFCMHAVRTPAGRTEHYLIELTLNDIDRTHPRDTTLQLRSFSETEKGPVGTNDAGNQIVDLPAPPPPTGAEGAWHRLTLAVTPELIWTQIGDKVIHKMPQYTLSNLLTGMFLPDVCPPEVRPGPEVQGGLGLILVRSAAAFRNVIVEPLPAEGQ